MLNEELELFKISLTTLREQLISAALEEWGNIPQEDINNIIESIPRQIRALYCS